MPQMPFLPRLCHRLPNFDLCILVETKPGISDDLPSLTYLVEGTAAGHPRTLQQFFHHLSLWICLPSEDKWAWPRINGKGDSLTSRIMDET